jgi:hypothetical protein
MARMRRLTLLAAVVAVALAPSAAGAAWTETATYDVPGGGIADCLRAADTDRLALLGSLERVSTPIDLLELQGDRLARLATSTLGWLPDCPEIATADAAPPLAAGIVLLPRGRGHFATALRVATLGEAPQTLRPAGGTPSVATAPGGAAIVAWIKRGPGLFAKARVMVAIRRSASAPFGTPTAVDGRPADQRAAVAGIDAAGRAVVAWRTGSPRNFLQEVVHVAVADASGRFGPPRTLMRTGGWSLALAVAPDGRALLVAEGLDGLLAYERLPGQADFTRVPLPSVPYVADLAVALNADGGAVIAYRTDPWSTAALVRPAGGAFRKGGDIAVRRLGNFRPTESAFAAPPLLPSLGAHAEPPYDWAGQDLAVALTPSGQMLMTWVQDEEGERAASTYVARGTLTDGFGAPSRVGGACRSATAARPLRFDDDALGVAWTDDAHVDTQQGELRRLGGGRAHIARDLAPDGPPPSAPAAPRMSARLMGPSALRATDPLRVRVRCERACDVRAVATARTLPQPWWSYGRRGGARQVLDASDALPTGGETTLRLDPENGSNAAGARGFPRTPIVVLACTPGNAVAERLELPAPRALPPGRIPSVTGLAARRRGDLVQATWRTTAPARRMHFTAYLLLAGGVQKPIVARLAGHGRTRFAATLHVPHGRQATRMGLVMRGPVLRLPDQTVVDVR